MRPARRLLPGRQRKETRPGTRARPAPARPRTEPAMRWHAGCQGPQRDLPPAGLARPRAAGAPDAAGRRGVQCQCPIGQPAHDTSHQARAGSLGRAAARGAGRRSQGGQHPLELRPHRAAVTKQTQPPLQHAIRSTSRTCPRRKSADQRGHETRDGWKSPYSAECASCPEFAEPRR